MISVLVTGSNGQLGKCLQDVSKNSSTIKWIFKSSVELDITEENSIKQAFKSSKIDYLVNCAAYTSVDKAESEIEKAFLVNAEGTRLLANACKEHKATLIHISTDFVFDGKKETPYLETDQPNPINIYGASKLKGEEYVNEILTNYFIIRTSWVYSEYGNNFVKTVLRIANERDEISVVNDQIGTPTNAIDLAKAIMQVVSKHVIFKEKNQFIDFYGTYNFSNEGQCSWYDFAKKIFEIHNISIILKSITTSEYPTVAKRPVYSVLDKTKFKETFDFKINTWKKNICKNIEL
jgi:dTDP-4-dehydrorhamnose reductase